MGKTEADRLLKIDIPWLKAHGYLSSCKSGSIVWNNTYWSNKRSVGIQTVEVNEVRYLRIHYIQTEDEQKTDFDYQVQLVKTACGFGGERSWFICPLSRNGVGCGRRVGTLYKCGDYFGCRHCFDLTYKSRNENRRYKLYGLFKTLTLGDRIDAKKQQIKRRLYAGKMTRKQRELERLYGNIPDIRHLY